MVGFEPSKKFPQDFDTQAFTLTVFPDNARYARLWGGGEHGEVLTVAALTKPDVNLPPGQNPPSPLIKLWDQTAWLADGDPDKEPNYRRFRVQALAQGEAYLHALTPPTPTLGPQDYAKPLKIVVRFDQGDSIIMKRAFDASRDTLRTARKLLSDLKTTLTDARDKNQAVSQDAERVYDIVQRWLKIPPLDAKDKAVLSRAVSVLGQAVGLMDRNLNLTGLDLIRTPENVFGRGPLNDSSHGMECGAAFFSHGPNCQRDVITHEFFHMIGLGHGEPKGSPIPPYADRNAVNTPELALNSCDNLAQMVCELNGGTTDACTRIND
jgi:hypothetical protein